MSKNVLTKIAAVSKAVGSIGASGQNAHFKYNYQPWEEVRSAIRTACLANGLWVHESMQSCQFENNKSTVTLEIVYTDLDSGESLSTLWNGEANDNQDKGIQKAATSALKYAWLKTFMLVEKDTDTDAGSVDTAKPDEGEQVSVNGMKGKLAELCGDKKKAKEIWAGLNGSDQDKANAVFMADSLESLGIKNEG